MKTIDKITHGAQQIAAGQHDRIRPGDHFTIPDSWIAGDAGAQGDLVIIIVDQIPGTYKRVAKMRDADRQLVPGNTEGARHCLDALKGVELYRQSDWGPDSLDGPCLVINEQRVIEHPTHGHWTIPAGRMIKLEYQREHDAELQRERRNAD
jgi:hypothetical protein